MRPFDTNNANPHLISLIFSLAQTAMAQMGKLAHPATGKVERDLDGAKVSIDLLIMLRDKTKGNLTPEEEKLLTGTLTDLELNYADESGKEEPPEKKEQKIFPGK